MRHLSVTLDKIEIQFWRHRWRHRRRHSESFQQILKFNFYWQWFFKLDLVWHKIGNLLIFQKSFDRLQPSKNIFDFMSHSYELWNMTHMIWFIWYESYFMMDLFPLLSSFASFFCFSCCHCRSDRPWVWFLFIWKTTEVTNCHDPPNSLSFPSESPGMSEPECPSDRTNFVILTWS